MGARDAWGTETLSVLGVSVGIQGYPGARRSNKASIYIACVTVTSSGVSHYGCNTTVAQRRPKLMSLAKSRTFPSSGVGLLI